MDNVFLLTGGNLGNRSVNLQQACKLIEKNVGEIKKISTIYETAAWGLRDQPFFLNQVLQVETKLDAPQLLKIILEIETLMGRKREIKMGPRIIDIDILFYGNEVINAPSLTIPHPEITNRRFVLKPLADIAANFIHPVYKKTISTLLYECKDELEVKEYEPDK